MKAFTWIVRVIGFVVMVALGVFLAWSFLKPAFLAHPSRATRLDAVDRGCNKWKHPHRDMKGRSSPDWAFRIHAPRR